MKIKITYLLTTIPRRTTWSHIIGPIPDTTEEELLELVENEMYNTSNALYSAYCPYNMVATYEVTE